MQRMESQWWDSKYNDWKKIANENNAEGFSIVRREHLRRLKAFSHMRYGTMLFMGAKIFIEFFCVPGSTRLQVIDMLFVCTIFCCSLAADHYLKIMKREGAARDDQHLGQVAFLTRGAFVLTLVSAYMGTFFEGTSGLTPVLGYISAIFGMATYVREATFCVITYVVFDASTFLALRAFVSSILCPELYWRTMLWITYYLCCQGLQEQLSRHLTAEAVCQYYYNVVDKTMTLVNRPFAVCDKTDLNAPIYNRTMRELMQERGFSSFSELAGALQVESNIVLKQRPKSRRRQHILHQFKPHSYCAAISLLEYIKQHVGKERKPECETRLLCVLRTTTGVEQFYVNVSTQSQRDEITVSIQQRSTHEIMKHRRSQNKARNLLLKTLSHNIRNPLVAITYLINQMATDPRLNSLEWERMRKLKNIADLMFIKADDLLDFALILEGEFALKREFVNIEELIRELKELLQQYVDEAVLRFDVKISNDVPETIFTDKARLLRILCHLGLNALKYTQKGFVALTIGYDLRKESVVFTILDTGVGMSPQRAQTIENFISSDFIEAAPRSFVDDPDEFVGLDNINSRSGTNVSAIDVSETGLGLYITSKLCEKFGSRLVVKGMEGHGASFSFSINAPIRKYQTVVQDSPEAARTIETKTPETQMQHLYAERGGQNLHSEQMKENELERAVSFMEGTGNTPDSIPDELPESPLRISEVPETAENTVETKKESHKYAEVFTQLMPKLRPRMAAGRPASLGKIVAKAKRALVVDDQQINRYVIRELVRKICDLGVDEAANGRDAVDKCEIEAYSIVFMDLDMPIMNGFEATRKLREREHSGVVMRVPIVAVTAYDTPEILNQAMVVGFDELLVKPVTLAKMRTCMGRFCPGLAAKMELS